MRKFLIRGNITTVDEITLEIEAINATEAFNIASEQLEDWESCPDFTDYRNINVDYSIFEVVEIQEVKT